MFGLALFAAWSPAHDDWLNEWSATPPTSSTMQAFRLPPAVFVFWLLGDDAVSVADGPLELAGLEHPANRRGAAPTAAAILRAWRKGFSSFDPPPVGRENVRLTLMHTSPERRRQGPRPVDPSEGLDGHGGQQLRPQAGRALVHAEVALMDVVRRAA